MRGAAPQPEVFPAHVDAKIMPVYYILSQLYCNGFIHSHVGFVVMLLCAA